MTPDVERDTRVIHELALRLAAQAHPAVVGRAMLLLLSEQAGVPFERVLSEWMDEHEFGRIIQAAAWLSEGTVR